MAIPIALLSEVVAAQLRTNDEAVKLFDIVAEERTLDAFSLAVRRAKPVAMVVELERLGDQPVSAVTRLAADTSGLVIVVCAFAKRALLDALAAAGASVVRSPVHLSVLRLQMLSLIVGDVLTAPAHPKGEDR